MKFQFKYVGPPFSREKPGAQIDVEEADVPDIRRAAHDWMEVSDTSHIVVEPKFIKIKGRPKQVVVPEKS